MTGQPAQTLETQERQFALALFFPALAVLLLTTPGDVFRADCREWFDGAIKNDDSADDDAIN